MTKRRKKRRKEAIKDLKSLIKHKDKKQFVGGRERDSKADMPCLSFMSLWGSRASAEGRR